jgi:hypothetical protein
MLTCECEPDLEACFDFQSRRSALSRLPFAKRTALEAAAFVFFQNSELGMLWMNVHNIRERGLPVTRFPVNTQVSSALRKASNNQIGSPHSKE